MRKAQKRASRPGTPSAQTPSGAISAGTRLTSGSHGAPSPRSSHLKAVPQEFSGPGEGGPPNLSSSTRRRPRGSILPALFDHYLASRVSDQLVSVPLGEGKAKVRFTKRS